MTQTTAAKTCLSVSSVLPATHDAVTFAALTWTQVGELSTLGDLVTQHNPVNFQNLCTGRTTVLKGSEQPILVDVTVALDLDDAGQTIMIAARKSKNAYAFKVTQDNGDIRYFVAFVMSEGARYGGNDDVIMAPYQLGIKAPSSAAADTIVVVNGA